MAWWQGFGGWLVTTLLALIAAVGVVVELVQRRRDRPRVVWNFDLIGTAQLEDGPAGVFVCTNVGRARAAGVVFQVVGGKLEVPEEKFLLPSTVNPGSSHHFLVRSDDLASAFVRVSWFNSDARRGVVAWYPLTSDSVLRDEWHAQLKAWKCRARWWRWYNPVGLVGPGGQVQTLIRNEPADRRVAAAYGVSEESGGSQE